MRILSICYEYPPLGGGGAKVVAGLTAELARAGHTIDLVTMWMPGLPFRERRDNFNLFRIPCIRLNRGLCRMWEMPLYLVFSLPVLFYLCFRRRYALNHTHFIFPDGVLSFIINRIFGLPYIITAHGSDVPGYNPDRFETAHRLLSPVWKRVVGAAARIVCPSRSIEQLILRQAAFARTTIIPNGIDTGKFQPLREKHDRILVVTRMFERKGVQYLVNALEGFNHGYEVHVVGDGPYLPVLEGRVEEKNLDVRFWGFLDNQSREIRDLYETSKIFVFTSEAENFPIVLLEAMASGLAIITTEGTGCSEVVGDAALLVKTRDSAGIRRCLEMLIADPELSRRLGAAARRRLAEKFGWSTVAGKYSLLYSELNNEHE
ncbi:MAG: glycosyltransferase family 4 protein [Gammaproteobacteria bacterium]